MKRRVSATSGEATHGVVLTSAGSKSVKEGHVSQIASKFQQNQQQQNQQQQPNNNNPSSSSLVDKVPKTELFPLKI
jgi:hypothetical protein